MTTDPPTMTVLDPYPPRSRRRAASPLGAALLVSLLFVAGVAIGRSPGTTAVSGSARPVASPAWPGAAGVGDAGLPVTAAALHGVWFEDTGVGVSTQPILARFSADGTFTLGGVLAADAWVSGTYQVRPTGVTFRPTGGACEAPDDFAWHVSVRADGRFEAVHLGGLDTAGDRHDGLGTCVVPVGEPYRFTRVSPRATAPGATFLPGYRSPDGPVTSAGDPRLAGYWLVSSTGQLLQIGADGRYTFDDDADPATPADAGTVRVDASSARFVSGKGAGCAEGNRMRWQGTRIEGGQLRAVVTDDSCPRALRGGITLDYLDVHIP